jgi:hypothetical protein
MNCNPTLVYPPDGVLIPPNTNVIEVHFTLGTPANNLFELSFENGLTDVKVYTQCKGATAADGMPLNGGCVFELNQNEWDYIAHTNRDGNPVKVEVRALGCDTSGNKFGASNTRQISFAKEDLVGALFYWASMRISGGSVNSGGIFSYDFGVRGQSATEILTPNSAINTEQDCIGCHDISRDGSKMIFDFDDNDNDDEYHDIYTDVYDLINKTALLPIVLGRNGGNPFPPGFHTWNRETTQFLLSDGSDNQAAFNGAFQLIGANGMALCNPPTTPCPQVGSLKGTTPDWAPDDSQVVFAVPGQ